MFEKIAKYLSLMSIAVFILSYAYLNAYYSSFHINITNYISTSEIFYTLLPIAGLLFSLGYAIFQGSLYRKKNTVKQNIEVKSKEKWYEKGWLLTLIGISSIVGSYFNSQYFKYRGYPLINCFCLAILFLTIGYATNKEEIKTYGFNVYMQIICFILLGYIFIQYGIGAAKINKELGNTYSIQFNYNNRKYITNNKLVLLGETQSTIFLYSKVDSCSLVLPRSKIDSLLILNK